MSRFGYPDYNYLCIANESKNNSKLSRHYDCKNRYAVQQQEISKDNSLSSYKWMLVNTNINRIR
jgi:hypothetical protein